MSSGMKVLIPASKGKHGIGHDEDKLWVLSSCCGSWMTLFDSDSMLMCMSCKTETAYSEPWNVTIPLLDLSNSSSLKQWFQYWTGLEGMEIDVKWW